MTQLALGVEHDEDCSCMVCTADPLLDFAYGDGIVVRGFAPWNPAYVLVDTPQGPSCRPTSLVRALVA